MSSLPTHPLPKPHRIMTSTARARTQPNPGGFMKEQDEEDAVARKRAMRHLVNSWQERLQLISVITTFFASTEAAMLVNTKPLVSDDWENNILKASNASLLGALILHVYSAVLSFLGAFLLIRYKLKEATREEMIAEGIKMVHSPLRSSVIQDVEQGPIDITSNGATAASAAERNEVNGSYPVEPPIISSHPHVEQVGLFGKWNVPSHLLSRTHALCVCLAAGGFILAIVGILCYAWASHPTAVSVFATTCLGGAVLSMVILLF
ncbi:hypothetical protein HD554DRAFT_2328364 [Boletus coccyginus]|nr:hypothetical protein HD554DRAFT_2328364 [Boletus coccyginus]